MHGFSDKLITLLTHACHLTLFALKIGNYNQVLTKPIRTLGRIMAEKIVDSGGDDGGDSATINKPVVLVRKVSEPVISTDTDNSPLDINNVTVNQVFEDPSEKIVDFSPVPLWQIGEENVIEYTLPHGYEEAGNDWIGIYKVGHESGATHRSYNSNLSNLFHRRISAVWTILLHTNIRHEAKRQMVMMCRPIRLSIIWNFPIPLNCLKTNSIYCCISKVQGHAASPDSLA